MVLPPVNAGRRAARWSALRSARRAAAAVAITAAAVTVAACGSGGSGPASSGPASSGPASSGNGSAAVTSVTLGYVPYADDAALFYARDSGIFARHGLNVTMVPQATVVAIEASEASGTEQFGFTVTPTLIELNAKGVPVRCVSTVDGSQPADPAQDSTVLIAGKGTGITSVAGLAGKTVAVPAFASLNALAVDVLARRAGLGAGTVRQVAVPFPQMPAALAQGRVQAAMIVAPFAQQAVAEGATVLGHPNTTLFPGATVSCVDAMGPYISAHRPMVAAFRAAVDESVAYCQGHQAACKATLAAGLGLPSAAAGRAKLSTNWDPAFNAASLTLIEGYMKEFGLISSEPPPSSMIWNP